MTLPLPSSIDTIIVGKVPSETLSSQRETTEVNGDQEMARLR